MSEKVKAHHLDRKACLYIRQSSPFQVRNYEESRRLQYAMAQRLRDLGWREVETIDGDQGRTADGTADRVSFDRMVADVCMGKVGIIAARELSRFARNSPEWQHLIEVCRVVDTVLTDHDTVYDARHGNDRLLLGLKGNINEYELDMLRVRSVEARHQKARRGELVVTAPVGFLKTEGGKGLEKDPDQRVQQAIKLVYEKFFELGSARQTLMWFVEKGLDLPATHPGPSGWHTVWKRPSYGAVVKFLTNPTYAGAYAYGHVEVKRELREGRIRRVYRPKARGEYSVLIKEHHEGYITWDQFQRIAGILTKNAQDFNGTSTGAPKKGAALLAGLLRCRRCGRKISVRYTGARHDVVRYICHRGRLDQGEPKCISFGGVWADDAISSEVLRVVQPAAVEAASRAAREEAQGRDEILATLETGLEAARYEADLAARKYDAADPENRLVAEELERRWNAALEKVREIEGRIDEARDQRKAVEPPDPKIFEKLAENVEGVWKDPEADVRLKKRIIRTLIEEVVVQTDSQAGELRLLIHWKGGLHSEVRLPRKRRGENRTHTPPDVVEAIRSLSLILDDKTIAGVLNRNGLRTGRGNRWGQMYVTSLRNHHGIAVHSPEKAKAEGWMNLTKAAAYSRVTQKTLRRLAEGGDVLAIHPLPDGPWIFRRADLDQPAVQRRLALAGGGSGHPTGPEAGQLSLDLPTT